MRAAHGARASCPQCVAQCGARARFFGDLEQGIDTFEAPAVGYDVDRSYDTCIPATA